jgi:hypothetical protein
MRAERLPATGADRVCRDGQRICNDAGGVSERVDCSQAEAELARNPPPEARDTGRFGGVRTADGGEIALQGA